MTCQVRKHCSFSSRPAAHLRPSLPCNWEGPHLGLAVTVSREAISSASTRTCGHSGSEAVPGLARVGCFSISRCKDRKPVPRGGEPGAAPSPGRWGPGRGPGPDAPPPSGASLSSLHGMGCSSPSPPPREGGSLGRVGVGWLGPTRGSTARAGAAGGGGGWGQLHIHLGQNLHPSLGHSLQQV